MNKIVLHLKSENVATLDSGLTRELCHKKTVYSQDDDRDDTWLAAPHRAPVISSLRQRSSETPKTHPGQC